MRESYFKSDNSFSSRISRLCWFIVAITIRPFVRIVKGRIICWSFNGTQYSCNPRYISQYLIDNNLDNGELYWVLSQHASKEGMDNRINVVRPHTIGYIFALYSSEFVITNCRTNKFVDFFIKKTGQKYIMTWHGATPLKKIEKDAEDQLPDMYIRNAKRDSQMCDLMLSNSEFYSRIIKNAFYYKGEILERGMPRNDVFFDSEKKDKLRKRLSAEMNIDDDTTIILYAPTFRSNEQSDVYRIDWQDILKGYQQKNNRRACIFLRLHPNSLGVIDVNRLMNGEAIYNLCFYPDMQELLLASDMLVTDYSSTMFEMGLQQKPCVLYVPDLETYDRDFYFDITSLPFPLSRTENELKYAIVNFGNNNYQICLENFNKKHLKNYDTGQACKALYEWMASKM